MTLRPDATKQLFLAVVRRAQSKYSFRLENFCIMENHIHFLIQPTGNSSLSRILQWILGVFASAWNRANGLSGHFWGARFFSKVISGVTEYLRIFRYIDENPTQAGLVSKSEDWAFGAVGYRTRVDASWLDDPPLDILGEVR